jgi:ketosteroid isomerase-like protein
VSRQNLELIGKIYEGWASGQLDVTMRALIDPDIEIYPDPESAWPGIEESYRGYDGIGRYLASIYAAFEDYRPEPERLLDAGERVVVLAIERGRGRHSGAEVEIRHTAHIWTVRDGRAARLDVNWNRERALASVGLEQR